MFYLLPLEENSHLIKKNNNGEINLGSINPWRVCAYTSVRVGGKGTADGTG